MTKAKETIYLPESRYPIVVLPTIVIIETKCPLISRSPEAFVEPLI